MAKCLQYWGEVVKMWWRNNFKNWIGVIGTVITVSFLIALFANIDLEPYALWIIFGIVIILFAPLFFWIPYKLWKEAAPDTVKDQMQNPKHYVFPYVRSVSASPVIDANERYLILSLYFPTSLVKEIEISPTIILVLNGCTSESRQVGKMKLTWQYVSRQNDLHIPLTEQMLNIVRLAVKDNIPVKVSLKINTENPQYYWETEEWTTLLLTRVN